jgi:hypothetical protein
LEAFFGAAAGISLIVGGVIVNIAWAAFCFSTVFIGILLLIFAPGILIAPFLAGYSSGIALLSVALEIEKE